MLESVSLEFYRMLAYGLNYSHTPHAQFALGASALLKVASYESQNKG